MHINLFLLAAALGLLPRVLANYASSVRRFLSKIVFQQNNKLFVCDNIE